MVGFSTIIPSPRGRGLVEGKISGCPVSFSLMANLPVSFSQTMCVRLGEEGRLKRIWVWLFLCFSFGGLGHAYLCCHLFQTTFS